MHGPTPCCERDDRSGGLHSPQPSWVLIARLLFVQVVIVTPLGAEGLGRRLGRHTFFSTLGLEGARAVVHGAADCKVISMESAGVNVSERVALKVGSNPLNQKYLDTKAKKSGHLL